MKEVLQREKIEKLAGELSKANTKLQIANEKLKELDKMKTEFVSIASHQLRSPLTAIKGYSSLLLEGSLGPISEKARGGIENIFESSEKLVKVVEDFLNITRIELGRMKYDISVFDLGELAKTIIKEQEPTIKKRGLAIEYQSDDKAHQISADQGKVAQVVSNLLDNAIKYTPSGWIKIKAENLPPKGKAGKEMVRLSIADSGVGLTKENLDKLFNKFVRADDAGKINVTGTGLGLYVAKQMVEGMAGKVWVESAGVNQGSTFFVEFAHSNEPVVNKSYSGKMEFYSKK